MFSTERRIYPAEIAPSSIWGILKRFGFQAGEESFASSLQNLKDAPFLEKLVVGSFGEYFSLAKQIDQCPSKELIVVAAILTGRGPVDISRMGEVFCGHVIKSEDSMGDFGPLSGRRGNDYVPFSQCWLVAQELRDLVRFMQTDEQLPALSQN